VIEIATVSVWKIDNNLGQVIKYTTDKDKTDLDNYSDLEKSLEYIKDEFKTEDKLFVSGINCSPDTALKDMVRVKNQFNRKQGVLGFHAYQSFKEGEVTPEQAHQIGIQLAKEMWGDRFQVVVSTHLNTNHYHNHFVINSISFVDGKKYYNNRNTYAELRRLNDCICKENNLSYLQEKKTKSGINYLNYQNKNIQYTNYYKTAKDDLDIAISISHNYNEFITILKSMKYEVINRSGKLSIRGEKYKRNIRIERYFGEDYSIENIKKQIQGTYLPTKKNYYKRSKKIDNYFSSLLKPKYNSFYGMYIRYCNILNIYPEYMQKNSISASMKEDIKKLDEISNQMILLANNQIETEEQFFSFYNELKNELIAVKGEREELWRLYREDKNIDKNEIKEKIDKLSNKIVQINDDINLCKKIESKKENIKEDIKKIEEKEMINDEFIR